MKIEKLIDESTNIEFKRELTKKSDGYLKTISAFLNGKKPGYLVVGLDDNKNTYKIDVDETQQTLSNQIKTTIYPRIIVQSEVVEYKGEKVILVTVNPGMQPPYYFTKKQKAYIRNGNTTIEAPSNKMNELILKGLNTTWDAIETNYKSTDLTFDSLKEKLKEEGIKYNASTLDNFGLISNGKLINAGVLLSDQNKIENSFVRAIKFKGVNRVSTIDDKEFRGSIISQIEEAIKFVENHTNKAWEIIGTTRVETLEYSFEAVREAIVNAIVHRDYSNIGCQVDLFIYDDRIEIVSIGKPIGGKTLKEIVNMDFPSSIRRNIKLADCLNRLKYMERSGTGFIRIKEFYKEDRENIIFHQDGDSICVEFKSRTFKNTKTNNTPIIDDLNKINTKIVKHVIEVKECDINSLIKLTKLTKSSLNKRLKFLVDNNYIKRSKNKNVKNSFIYYN